MEDNQSINKSFLFILSKYVWISLCVYLCVWGIEWERDTERQSIISDSSDASLKWTVITTWQPSLSFDLLMKLVLLLFKLLAYIIPLFGLTSHNISFSECLGFNIPIHTKERIKHDRMLCTYWCFANLLADSKKKVLG